MCTFYAIFSQDHVYIFIIFLRNLHYLNDVSSIDLAGILYEEVSTDSSLSSQVLRVSLLHNGHDLVLGDDGIAAVHHEAVVLFHRLSDDLLQNQVSMSQPVKSQQDQTLGCPEDVAHCSGSLLWLTRPGFSRC